MPKTEMDYSKTIIYKICCNDTNIKEEYVGHTTNFVKRKSSHKTCCNNVNDKRYNFYVYKFIRENNGWDNWNMVMIEEYNCENRFQAETRERYWIETLQSKLNKKIPTRTVSIQEYYKEHKAIILKQTKQYREIHKEEISEKKKEYYEKRKAEINEKHKTKYTCECGSITSISNKTKHNKTKKHIAFLELTEN